MVGEIRDKETAQLAVQAALTGHLVFSTIHTNNAVGVIPRLIDMGIDPYLIGPTLILDMAQRYYDDAKHFRDKGDIVTAFAALNYAHGFLDAGARMKLFDVKDSRLFASD